MENTTKKITLAGILTEVNGIVDKLNENNVTEAERMELEKSYKDLCKSYAETSLLTAYAHARKHAQPIIELARLETYPTIKVTMKPDVEVKDGEKIVVRVYSVDTSTATHNILAFIKWLQARNVKMPVDWIPHMSAVKANILDQWKAYDEAKGDTAVFDFKSLKTILQPMVDDMGFIKGKKGGNALVATKEHAQTLLKFANELTGTTSGTTLSPKNWDKLLMSLLHSLATSKAFQNEYGSTAIYKEAKDEPTEDEKSKDETKDKPQDKSKAAK